MDDLGWERNMSTSSFPWSHHRRHHHQEIEESFIFGSENILLNPIQHLQHRTDSSVKPAAGAGRHQMGSINVPGSSSSSQYWAQTLAANGFQKDKNVISITTSTAAAAAATSLESLDCLLSATNSNGETSSYHDDGISVIFSDYKNLCNNIVVTNNNNFSGSSSGNSVTKETDDGIVSPEKTPITKRSNDTLGLSFSDDNPRNPKKPRSDPSRLVSSNINFRQASSESEEPDSEAIAQMKEMIYRAAAFRPVSFADEEVVEKPRRKNVKISNDPQTVAARQRRERISEKIRVLQKLVPGGNKMDTASMLDEAANYLKFLRSQVKELEQVGTTTNARSTSHMMQNNIINPNDHVITTTVGVPFNHNPFPMQTHFLLPHHHHHQYLLP